MSKTLIHTALLCEAQIIIDYFKLKKDNLMSTSYKLYTNDNILLIVSGMGEKNTTKAISYIFEYYKINKAINFGIAGTSDKSINIGTLFCTNRILDNIPLASITSVDKALDFKDNLDTLLVDMEAKYFTILCKEYNIKDFYIFKIVSDYLNLSIPKKSFVIQEVKKSFSKWKKYI